MDHQILGRAFWMQFWPRGGVKLNKPISNTVSYDPKNLKIVDLLFISTALKTCVSQPLRKYQMSQVKACQGGAALTIISTRPLWISHQFISFKASHFPTREEMLLLKGLRWGDDYRLNTIKRILYTYCVVVRETVSFVFPRVLMFPEMTLRETSGLLGKQN